MFEHDKRLILVVSTVLICGFLLTSLASYLVAVTSIRDNIAENELPLTGDNIYSEIQRDLLRPIFVSSLMASDTFLRSWVIEGEADATDITRYLKEVKERYNAFTAFFVSERSRNYYHADGLLKQVSEHEPRDAWYFRVSGMERDHEINVDVDMANDDRMTVFVNFRVYDFDGNFIGATGVGLTVDAVKVLVDRYHQTYQRDILFLDNAGRVRLHSTHDADSQGYFAELQKMASTPAFLDKLAKRTPHSFEFDLPSRSVLLNTRYIEEFDWHLLVVQGDTPGTDKLLDVLAVNLAVFLVVTSVVLFTTHRTIASYQSDIARLASTDELTGLYNRQALDVLYRQLAIDRSRQASPFAVMLFDIDHFKSTNDRYGHLAGDAVLRHVAQLLSSRLRGSDIISRWGGEEFLVLLKDTPLASARKIAKQACQSVSDTPLVYQGERIEVTISGGVVEHRDGESRDQVIARADKALYAAKHAGRNRIVSNG